MSEVATTEAEGPKKSPDERKQILARQIGNLVAQGRRVESQGDYQAVLVHGHRPNHVLHLILTLVTLGIWVIGWIVIAIVGGEKREMVQVDEWGNPSVQRL